MDNPLISILTPFKNTSDFLHECIDSVLEQSYENWELCIVDDHSEDNSYDIVSHYAENDRRIRLYKNPGTGIIEALRMAYSKSRGTFITRMDSDDVMVREKLQLMKTDLELRGPGHIALGLVKYFSEEGISDGYQKYEAWLNRLTREGNNFLELYKECVIASPCWMVYRKDLDAAKAFQPNRYPEDYDLTFRFYESGLKCIPSNRVLHYWRDYQSRTSRNHEHYAQNYFLDIKIRYFLSLDYDSKRVLTVWGAGFKGKTIAKVLIENNIDFRWICDNPKKICKRIYGHLLESVDILEKLDNPQSIITVANPIAQEEIKTMLEKLGMRSMTDYFFFC